jgi:hypothetical protein
MPIYGSLGSGELLFVALISLVLVLRNLWGFIRYALERRAPAVAPVTVAPAVVAASRRPAVPPVLAGIGQLRLAGPPPRPLRRRYVPKVLRPGHRAVKPQQA